MLTKINYKIHTDAIKEKIVLPQQLSKKDATIDYADVSQLVCLSNLENINAEYIRAGLLQGKRLLMLNESAIHQMKSLVKNNSVKKLIK